jgi:hypothetical protein
MIESSLPVLKFNVDDEKTLKFQLREADRTTPVDITGLTLRFFARVNAGDPDYIISPVVATLTDPVNGRFEFDVTMPSTPDDGLYWIEREGGVGNIDTFPPAKGTEIRILEK